MNETNDTADLMGLLDAMCTDRLSEEEFARLQNLLRDDPAAQQTYLAYLDVHLGLKHLVAVESGNATLTSGMLYDPSALPVKRGRAFTIGRTLVACVAVAASVIVVALLWARNDPARQQVAMTIAELGGSVAVYGVRGKPRAATMGMEVYSGERIETSGPGALAVMIYEDGTRLAFVNESSATSVADGRKSVVLHHGIVSAQVAPQPAGRPMLLATPSAKIEVLGTRFAIAATTDRTELSVSEGRVQLTRVSDGKSVEVAQGQGVVTNGGVTLTVRESGGPRDAWDADFEQGVPEGWTGAFIKADLPAGSAGAIRAVGEKRGSPDDVYLIASREEWVEGLFSVHDDSHLHITLKMEHPDWLNVFLSTRGSDATRPTWALHNFNEVPFWPPKPGQWRTVTIPLSKFRRKRDGEFHNEPPVVGEVAYRLSISATEPDRGLVVDRIWVTRGGPGEVEATVLP